MNERQREKEITETERKPESGKTVRKCGNKLEARDELGNTYLKKTNNRLFGLPLLLAAEKKEVLNNEFRNGYAGT